ncbi:MAG: carboxypeptidase-like regulatory domain-containing protein [Flavobacteriales bacterium]
MKRLLFFIPGLIFSLVAGRTQDSLQQIQGLVTDPDMKAVAGMQVSLFSGKRYTIHTRTDSNGYFCIHTADTGAVKLEFRQGKYSFQSEAMALGERDSILMNIRYKGRPELTLRYTSRTNQEIVTEVPLWKEIPQRIIYHEVPENSLYPKPIHYRTAEMMLQNWQYSQGENLYITFAPLNTSR